MLNLQIIIASTRPTRVGPKFASWFLQQAKKDPTFHSTIVDLKEVNLPFLDEPKHPSLGQYEHAHTQVWSATIKKADAFVFVTPEYNFNVAPPLANAIDYLFAEWAYKPAGFVSYGGVSGGTRGVQATKAILSALKVVAIPEAVTIPFFGKALDDAGNFTGGPSFETAANNMLKELGRWAKALAPLRQG